MARKILIVDDEIESFGFLPETLEVHGFAVESVDSGEKAVALSGETFFDIILMDYNLPGMNGVEAFRQIRELHPRSRGILMTAAAPPAVTSHAAEYGFCAVLLKPFKVDAVIAAITRALEQ